MGYKISINGEQVWESESDHTAVDKVSISNSRGEVAVVGSSTNDDWLSIEVNERDSVTSTYLDMADAAALKARQESLEAPPAPPAKSTKKAAAEEL